MENFDSMELHPAIQKSLTKYRIVTPTDIQVQAIPSALEGMDILASAPTGTGKTLAFAIPMIMRIIENQAQRALIVLPTRELAQQLQTEVNKLLESASMRCVLIIGGAPMSKQIHQLAQQPKIIIGTPGRIIDHMEQQTIQTDDVDFLVLDEMDRMFDMGFGVQIQEIMKNIAVQRQTLMFTATLPPKVAALAKKHLKTPKILSVGDAAMPSEDLEQKHIHTSESQKFDILVEELTEREGSVIIFVKTKISADRLANQLTKNGHKSLAMHGDLRPHQRKRVITDFRKGRTRIMVATDVATRGIDIPHIQHVVNYDLPQSPEDFIHRIGRTARAGSTGHALNIISAGDKKYWKAINRYIESDGQDVMEFKRPAKKRSGGGGRRDGAQRSSRPRRDDRNSDGAQRSSRPRRDDRNSDGAQRSSRPRRDDRNSDGAQRSSRPRRDDRNSDGAQRSSRPRRDDRNSDGAQRSSRPRRDDRNSDGAQRSSSPRTRHDSTMKKSQGRSANATRSASRGNTSRRSPAPKRKS